MSDCGIRMLHEARTSGLVPGDFFKQPRLPDQWGSTPAGAVINPRPGTPRWGGERARAVSTRAPSTPPEPTTRRHPHDHSPKETSHMKKRPIILTTAIAAGAILLGVAAGCTQKTQEPYRDAKVTHRYSNPGVETYANADGFSNVAEFCDAHGNRIVIAFHGDGAYSAITAIPTDPSCTGSRR
jgi:hypothetical protein